MLFRSIVMLTGKIALVTGAGRGIGREIALVLAANGATVIVNYNGSKESAEAVVAEIVQKGGSAEAIQCNPYPNQCWGRSQVKPFRHQGQQTF